MTVTRLVLLMLGAAFVVSAAAAFVTGDPLAAMPGLVLVPVGLVLLRRRR